MTKNERLESALADTYLQISELAQLMQHCNSKAKRLEALGLLGRLVDVAIAMENALEFIAQESKS